MEIFGDVRWIKPEAQNELEAVDRFVKDSKARGGYVDDKDDEDGSIMEF